ncbi:S8 family peptidase [Planotetraspora mira]|uniref:S8 family peptidase n=1 Tax=Planotetraspora mira TaxID=58121 RepID=UPI00366EE9FC
MLGEDVVIAILDTGCDLNHNDLKNRIIGGKNFTHDFNGDINNFNDNNGHGTHVAGIIGAENNNSGIIGVAPKSKLLILKVLSEDGTGDTNWIIDAIKYCINWRGSNCEKVRIISMSLGCETYINDLHEVIVDAAKNNIVMVCAAGNNGDGKLNTEEFQFPAVFSEVIQVGAINRLGELADFSNTNSEVDVLAPGVDIISTFINDSYIKLTGTSMAAPHISGAMALVISECNNKELSLKDLKSKFYKYIRLEEYEKKCLGAGVLEFHD